MFLDIKMYFSINYFLFDDAFGRRLHKGYLSPK